MGLVAERFKNPAAVMEMTYSQIKYWHSIALAYYDADKFAAGALKSTATSIPGFSSRTSEIMVRFLHEGITGAGLFYNRVLLHSAKPVMFWKPISVPSSSIALPEKLP
jgi:hypothetical protein